jgi:alpha-D-ribose 1-methylphosphonate 5-triphosphate diphosphatase
VFQLVDEGSITLSEGTELVSTNPAKAVGLEDRGQIAVGKRADLIRVREIQVGDRDMSSAKQSMPVVRAVFREGMRVA